MTNTVFINQSSLQAEKVKFDTLRLVGGMVIIMCALGAVLVNFEMLLGFTFFKKCLIGGLLLMPVIAAIELKTVFSKSLSFEKNKLDNKYQCASSHEVAVEKSLKIQKLIFESSILSESISFFKKYSINSARIVIDKIGIVSINLSAHLLPAPIHRLTG